MTDVLSTQSQWPRSTMPGLSQQQQNYRKNTRRTLPKHKNDNSPLTTPRKVTLFRNGDRYFAGKQIAIIPQHYSNLGQLLQELSSTVDLPYGVRRLFTPNKGSEVTDVNIIRDGGSYVCASFEPFQKLEYAAITLPRVTFNIEQRKSLLYIYFFYELERCCSFIKDILRGFSLFIISLDNIYFSFIDSRHDTNDFFVTFLLSRITLISIKIFFRYSSKRFLFTLRYP